MTQVGTFTPDQSRLIWETVQRLRQSRFFRNGMEAVSQFDQSPIWVPFENTSGETIPPYAVMQVVGVDTVAGFTYLSVDKPSGPTAAVLVNNEFPVADGEFGSGYRFGVVNVLSSGTLSPGDACQTAASSWEIVAGPGPFVILGDVDGIGGSIARLTGLGGVQFVRFQLAADLTGTTVSADIFDRDGTTLASGATLEDPEEIFTGLTSGTRGIGMADAGRYFILNANCPVEPEE